MQLIFYREFHFPSSILYSEENVKYFISEVSDSIIVENIQI